MIWFGEAQDYYQQRIREYESNNKIDSLTRIKRDLEKENKDLRATLLDIAYRESEDNADILRHIARRKLEQLDELRD